MDRLREFLKFAGKGQRKVVAVFAGSSEDARDAVAYVRRGVPDLPLWLFASVEPPPATAALCERVVVEPDALALVVAAQKELWPCWVALAAGVWKGSRGRWLVKLAPLVVPPFRAVLGNRQGDWFAATPRAIARHAVRAMRDTVHAAGNRAKDIHRGAWLWAAGVVAGWCLGALRGVFRWRRDREKLQRKRPHAGEAGGSACPTNASTRVTAVGQAVSPARLGSLTPFEGMVEFRYSHRQWDQRELEQALSSGARWILFLEDGAEAADLTAPFADERTFAVTRQTGYRDWKPFLLPMAPFRRLQPEEFSETLAPLSNVALVDRAKLAHLGVPRTCVPGAAWLWWFWRAAQLGWRSYSAGAPQPAPEFADRPFEEAEFVLRSWRGVGQVSDLPTAHAARARGSIAQARWGETAGRPAVLVVSPYLPYPLSHGGAVRIYNLCRALAGRVDFLLASFREKGEAVNYQKLHEVFREVYVVDRDERALRDAGLPRQVRDHASSSMRALIADLAPRADLLQVEFTHLAHFRDSAPALPAILVEHDITFTLYRQYGDQREYERWLAYEKQWLARYDAVWTMSEDDRDLARASGGPAHTVMVANGVDLARFVPQPCAEGDPEIFYIGSFRHRPNIIGFERLRREVMPRVWERFPAARLRVVAGPEPEKYWERPPRLDARIAIEGFVEDVRPLYARATVVAVPLLVSAGTNIKVMEAMACQRPIVTTPVGCRGLGLRDGCEALVREDSAGLAAAICEVLARPDEAARIAANARRTAEERFSWEAIAEEAFASYSLVGQVSGLPWAGRRPAPQ